MPRVRTWRDAFLKSGMVEVKLAPVTAFASKVETQGIASPQTGKPSLNRAQDLHGIKNAVGIE
jgi:hypothetical protein